MTARDSAAPLEPGYVLAFDFGLRYIGVATGQTVTLTPAGTLEVTGDGDVETVNFTYTAASSTGATDVGFVTVGSVPCFVAAWVVYK